MRGRSVFSILLTLAISEVVPFTKQLSFVCFLSLLSITYFDIIRYRPEAKEGKKDRGMDD